MASIELDVSINATLNVDVDLDDVYSALNDKNKKDIQNWTFSDVGVNELELMYEVLTDTQKIDIADFLVEEEIIKKSDFD